jgi:hypothetical protein
VRACVFVLVFVCVRIRRAGTGSCAWKYVWVCRHARTSACGCLRASVRAGFRVMMQARVPVGARACLRARIRAHAMHPPSFPPNAHAQTHADARARLEPTGDARSTVRQSISRYDKTRRNAACASMLVADARMRTRTRLAHAGEGAHLRASTQMGTGLGAARAEGAHMDVILDAHVSRWNTSGSVPPMLPLNLLIKHVVAAQLVAHVKVYVPTHARAAARGSLHWRRGRPTAACTSMQRPRTLRGIGEELEGAPGAAVGVAVASNNLCAARMEGCARAEASKIAPATHGTCRERNATCGDASSCEQHTRCCALQHAVLQRATRRVATCNARCCNLQPYNRQPAPIRATTCSNLRCNLQHVMLQDATRRAAS